MDEKARSVRAAGAREDAEILREALTRTRRALIQTVHAVSLVAGLGDSYTALHQEQVALLAVAVGRRLGLEEQRLEGLYLGALIHDVGKVAVPSALLTKAQKLTPEEFAAIRTHVRVGVELLANVSLPWPVQAIIGQHHERLDGSGYPDGLCGNAIIAEARITAVADVFEAMSERRSYRAALGQEAALAELERGCGVTVDRDAVAALKSLLKDAGAQDIWTYLKADQLASTVILPRYRATP